MKSIFEALYQQLNAYPTAACDKAAVFTVNVQLDAPLQLNSLLPHLKQDTFYYLNQPEQGGATQILGLGKGIRLAEDNRASWIAGVNHCLHIQEKRQLHFPLFCLMGFDEHPEQHWTDFPLGFCWIPNLHIRVNEHQCEACLWLDEHAPEFNQQRIKWLNRLKRLIDTNLNHHHKLESVVSVKRQTYPCIQPWTANIKAAQSMMKEQLLQKVVLAREEIWTLSAKDTPLRVFCDWQIKEPDARHFFIQWQPNKHFFGCTPETLFRRKGLKLESEALAGTTPRDNDPQRDNWLGLKLLHDHKNNLENRAVERYINCQLKPFTKNPVINHALRLKKLARVQHLCRPVSAQLKPDTATTDLINALHPTPAVAGTPVNLARQFIRQHEAFSRGWYAGTFGLIEQENAYFSVALRCAKCEDKQLSLYSGAGIMPASDPVSEYNELNKKTELVTSLLSSRESQTGEEITAQANMSKRH
jgi:isochorismate synthase